MSMETPVGLEEPRREGTHPLLIVAGTVLTVVLVTLLVYSIGDPADQDTAGARQGGAPGAAGDGGACGQAITADPSYSVDVVPTPNPPRPEGTTLLLTLRHDGKPITGAKVCVTADMPEMQHPAINVAARETNGRYETARIQFGMGGTWKTWVTVAEPDRPVVSVPLSIEVAPVSPN